MHSPGIGTEKRRAQRVRVNLTAQYRSDALSLDGRIRDLSCDGVFLRADLVDSSGSDVSLEFALPGSAPVRLRGEVVRVVSAPRASGMAIRFREIDVPIRLQLANYMLLQNSRNRELR